MLLQIDYTVLENNPMFSYFISYESMVTISFCTKGENKLSIYLSLVSLFSFLSGSGFAVTEEIGASKSHAEHQCIYHVGVLQYNIGRINLNKVLFLVNSEKSCFLS